MNSQILIVNVLIGIFLLLFGRRVFWFFVAAAGFAAGLFIARDQLQLDSQVMVLALAVLLGVIGAILSLLIQKLVIAVAGFGAGGFLGAALLHALNLESLAWLGFILAGIFGAILMLVVFDWALILLSSLLGAALVADGLAVNNQLTAIVFLVAAVVGLIVQSAELRRSRATAAANLPRDSSR